MMTDRSRETPVAGDQNGVEGFSQGDIDSVIVREDVPQRPHAWNQEVALSDDLKSLLALVEPVIDDFESKGSKMVRLASSKSIPRVARLRQAQRCSGSNSLTQWPGATSSRRGK